MLAVCLEEWPVVLGRGGTRYYVRRTAAVGSRRVRGDGGRHRRSCPSTREEARKAPRRRHAESSRRESVRETEEVAAREDDDSYARGSAQILDEKMSCLFDLARRVHAVRNERGISWHSVWNPYVGDVG